MNFLKFLFGNYSKRELKRIRPICNAVLELESKYLNMSDEELASQTDVLKKGLKPAKRPTTFYLMLSQYAAKLQTEFLVCATSLCR